MGNREDKVKDAALAVAEVGAETPLDNLPELSGALASAGLHGAASVVADGVVGAVVPGLFGAVLGYRVRRSERNLVLLITELSDHVDEVDRRLAGLERQQQEKFSTGAYRDALLDNIIDENESEKVHYSVNAFINGMGERDITDGFMLTLFDDLARLNRVDLRVLNLYGDSRGTDDYMKLISEEDIDESQYRSIRQKLCRFGLLQSKNEGKRERNLEIVQESLAELIKQLGANKPKKVKVPKYQHVLKSDSYEITSLGRRYLWMIQPIGESR